MKQGLVVLFFKVELHVSFSKVRLELFVTSCGVIAKFYVVMISSFLEDCRRALLRVIVFIVLHLFKCQIEKLLLLLL